ALHLPPTRTSAPNHGGPCTNASRRATLGPRRVALKRNEARSAFTRGTRTRHRRSHAKPWVGGWRRACCGAEQRSRAVGARIARASSSDSSRLSERSERSERSEFRDATARRAAQGSRRNAATAAV